VLANDGIDGDMSPEIQVHGVITQEGDEWLSEMDPFVLDMHTRNGLIEDCKTRKGCTLSGAEDTLIEAAMFVGQKPRSVVLAGSTVAFDQSFLVVHMPRLAELLSHRCFDVSTLKMAERDWAGEKFKKAEAHRALPDVLESLAHAAEIRRSISRWSRP